MTDSIPAKKKIVKVWFKGQLIANYQNDVFSMGKEWRNAIYIGRPEDKRIISLLERIVTLLETDSSKALNRA